MDNETKQSKPSGLICVHCGSNNGINYTDIVLCIRCMSLTRAQPDLDGPEKEYFGKAGWHD